MPEWTDEELIVLVYFRSRGVLARVIKDILPRKGGALRENSGRYGNKIASLVAKEQKAGRPAMYDKASKTWDLRATDQWLVDLIVGRAREIARARDKDESKAPLYYSELKALTELKEDEQRMIGDVSLESIQWNCSPCVDTLLQIQTLAPIMARLAWTVELPATPSTEIEQNEESSQASAVEKEDGVSGE